MFHELAADHSGLEPAFQLIYRGIASDADQARIVALLAKLLHVDAETAQAALTKPPLLLTSDTDRDKLRRLQLGLAKLGCICNLEPAWRHQNWFFNQTLLDHYDTTANSGKSQAIALLRINPAPGQFQLKKLAANLQDGDTHVLNHSDLLIQREQMINEGVGRWLHTVHQRALSGMRQAEQKPQISSGFALFPEDGQQLEELLDVLDRRAQQPPLQAISNEVTRLQPRLLAGKTWHVLLQHGIQSLNQPDLPQQLRQDLQQQWPISDDRAEKPPLATGKLQDLLQAYARKQQMRDDHRDSLLQQFVELDKLPSLPAVAMQAYQLAKSTETPSQKLADAVAQDPSLSARLLTVVNSPYFGLRSRVDSIPHALVILGREELAHLALLLSTETVFRGLSNEAGQKLWRHSAKTAEIARCLARKHEHFQPSAIYTAALLHDVGKIFLLSFAPRQLQDMDELAQRYQLPSYELEREWFGHDHATLGAAMLRRWGLPENLCRAVEQHHGPVPGQDEALSADAALVALADHIAQRLDELAPWADTTRLRRAQAMALQPYFGQLDLETIDLLAEDIRSEIRQSAPS